MLRACSVKGLKERKGLKSSDLLEKHNNPESGPGPSVSKTSEPSASASGAILRLHPCHDEITNETAKLVERNDFRCCFWYYSLHLSRYVLKRVITYHSIRHLRCKPWLTEAHLILQILLLCQPNETAKHIHHKAFWSLLLAHILVENPVLGLKKLSKTKDTWLTESCFVMVLIEDNALDDGLGHGFKGTFQQSQEHQRLRQRRQRDLGITSSRLPSGSSHISSFLQEDGNRNFCNNATWTIFFLGDEPWPFGVVVRLLSSKIWTAQN